MSDDDKPLHVRVAEALGDTVHEVAGVWYTEREIDAADARNDSLSARPVAHYDTDWSATGPLIVPFKIRLIYTFRGRAYADHPSVEQQDQELWEPDILPAVCRVILALHAVGKLPR